MSARETEFLRSLRATFKIEAGEHLQTIAAGLLELEKTGPASDQAAHVETAFRAAHSLKGAARAVNFGEVESICESLENSFAAWKRQGSVPSPREMDGLHRLLNTAVEILNAPEAGNAPSAGEIASPSRCQTPGPSRALATE
ncbi:MAG TPA: Hpt domain-containing protein, partial [Verrucomicrobiae bacterium]|nr:Hpt domain-containing protein [Verrucomicrobiae bacterium]